MGVSSSHTCVDINIDGILAIEEASTDKFDLEWEAVLIWLAYETTAMACLNEICFMCKDEVLKKAWKEEGEAASEYLSQFRGLIHTTILVSVPSQSIIDYSLSLSKSGLIQQYIKCNRKNSINHN